MKAETVQLTADQVAASLAASAAEPAAPAAPPAVEAAPAVQDEPAPPPPSEAPRDVAQKPEGPEPRGADVMQKLEAQLEDLRAKLAGADASGVRAELDSFRAEVAAADAERLTAARASAFERLKIDPDYHDVVPATFDPRTPEGRRELEAWIAKRPRLTRSGAATPPPAVAAEGFAPPVRDILSGKRRSGLVSAESIAKMLATPVRRR